VVKATRSSFEPNFSRLRDDVLSRLITEPRVSWRARPPNLQELEALHQESD
jgi:hypothetical protein